MAMTTGSVSVNSETAEVSGSGFAKALYDDYAPKALAGLPEGAPVAAAVAARTQVADLCNSFAKVIDYVKANASVTVTIATTDSGLQRTPNPNNANTDTQGPSSDKELSGTVA